MDFSEVQPIFNVVKGTKNSIKREQKKYFLMSSGRILSNKRGKSKIIVTPRRTSIYSTLLSFMSIRFICLQNYELIAV